MRSHFALTVVLVATALAGCLGADDDPTDGTDDETTPEVIPTLEALQFAISSTNTDAWIAPGTVYPVTASAPTNAVGDVSYTWGVGAMPDGTSTVAIDTGLIAPGDSFNVDLENAGVYRFHCHPHPFMTHNVVVLDGVETEPEVTVFIEDSDVIGEYRYSPQNLVVGPGTTVVYRNAGDQPHTATLSSAEPSIDALDFNGTSGDVTLDGDGWMRIVALAQDSEGRVGIAEKHLYVKTLPENYNKTISGTFQLSNMDGVPVKLEDASVTQHALGYAGALTIDLTVGQAADAQPVNQVEVVFKLTGNSPDVIYQNPGPGGSASFNGTVTTGNYELILTPVQGANIEYTAVVSVVYALVPPPMPGADGHAHHH